MTVSRTKPQGSSAGLLATMSRIFAGDGGLGELVEYNGRPDMADRDKALQLGWADALISLHGINRVARVYAEYARNRRWKEAKTLPPVGCWDNLVLGTTPVFRWERDLYGFLCVVCGTSFPSILIDDGQDPSCVRCARNVEVEPSTALPLWKAYSHSRFEFPGVRKGELPRGPSTVSVLFSHEKTERTYTTGDASLLYPELSRLPGLSKTSSVVTGNDLETISLFIEAAVEREGRGFDIAASFTYDPEPEAPEEHPYGFRFTAARLTTSSSSPTRTTEYTDVYAMLEALVTGLYG
jgi:hypothetical protein